MFRQKIPRFKWNAKTPVIYDCNYSAVLKTPSQIVFHPPHSSSIRHQTIYRGLSMKSSHHLLGGLIFEYWNFLRISTAYIWYLEAMPTPWPPEVKHQETINVSLPSFLEASGPVPGPCFFFPWGNWAPPVFFNRVLIAAYWCKIIVLYKENMASVHWDLLYFSWKGRGGFTEVGLPDTLIVRVWSLICGCMGHGLSSCNWRSRMMSFCRASAY